MLMACDVLNDEPSFNMLLFHKNHNLKSVSPELILDVARLICGEFVPEPEKSEGVLDSWLNDSPLFG